VLKPKYKRVLLKLSGESLVAAGKQGIDLDAARRIAGEVASAQGLGTQLAIVVGGGNIIRGCRASEAGLDRTMADNMGMLGTVINALSLQGCLEELGFVTRVQTAIGMQRVAEPYIRRRAQRHLEKGRIVILAGGTGNPYFSTDTAAVLRALEIGAEVLLKATKVDGVYDGDPVTNKKARLYKSVSYRQVLAEKLKVMDATAIALAEEQNLPITVFNMFKKGNIKRVVSGQKIGTLIKE
jgi:uridylate kinase